MNIVSKLMKYWHKDHRIQANTITAIIMMAASTLKILPQVGVIEDYGCLG